MTPLGKVYVPPTIDDRPFPIVHGHSFGICDSSIKSFGVAAPQLGQIYLCSMGTYDLEQNGQVTGIGSFGTSLTTSFVTSRVSTRVLPPPPRTKTSPPERYDPPPEEELEAFLPIALAAALPANPLLLTDGFADPDDFEDDLERDVDLEDDEPDPPFMLPRTRNKTATITTAATVTNTMIAVNRIARGMLYNS